MKKIKLMLMINVIIFLICIQLPSFARYYQSLKIINCNGYIAEPIIRVESMQETVKTEVNRLSNIQEYYFIIKNYETDSNGNKRINEVDFSYDIEIKHSSNNFPIKYELYDCSTGEEILKGNNKVSQMNINKNIEFERKYKLLVYWNKLENMSSSDNIDIVVNANQKNYNKDGKIIIDDKKE